MVQLVRTLRAGVDYEIDGDGRTVALTDKGTDKVEDTLGGINLYEDDNLDRLTQINVALHAEVLLRKDVDYLVRDGEVSLINNNRGRIAKLAALARRSAGRRRGEGGRAGQRLR